MSKPDASPTRRQFLELTSAAALSTLLPQASGARLSAAGSPVAFDPKLLPPLDEVWGWFETFGNAGPRYAGNDGHRKFVDWLEGGLREAKLTTSRDSYTFPRWEAKKWSLKATPKGGSAIDVPVTSYYPHSGSTGAAGITAPLVYVGKFTSDGSTKPDLSGDLKGKIAFVDYEIAARDYNEWYQPWATSTPEVKLEKYVSSVMAQPFEDIAPYKKAGAAGVVIGWTNISEAHATGQHWPFGRPLQEIPALLVGPTAGTKLRELARAGGTATLTLEADVFQNAKTDSVMGTLPGASDDEALIVYTHTDGPNMVQENAGLGLVALARYFSKMPQSSRKRTLVFGLVTGHDVGAYVRGTEAILEKHPDVAKKVVGAVAVEHLGCRSWRDDASMRYVATGGDELTYAMTNHQPVAKITLDGITGTAERHCAIVKIKPKGRYLGLGGSLARTGLPTLGWYMSPTYLNMEAPDGCLSKLSKTLMYGQLQAIAKVVHRMDVTSAADLKGSATPSQP
jgi:hypothetical protein